MKKRSQKLFLTDIRESIVLIEKYLDKMTFEKFSIDFAARDAVAMRFAIIGEAAKNVSSVFRNKHKDIPWNYMCGFRNVVIHEYFGVNIRKVWKTAKEDLPPLKKQIEAILEEGIE